MSNPETDLHTSHVIYDEKPVWNKAAAPSSAEELMDKIKDAVTAPRNSDFTKFKKLAIDRLNDPSLKEFIVFTATNEGFRFDTHATPSNMALASTVLAKRAAGPY